jgi:hypothetical protein
VTAPPSAGFFELDVELDPIEPAIDRWASTIVAAAATTTAVESRPGSEPEPEPELTPQ